MTHSRTGVVKNVVITSISTRLSTEISPKSKLAQFKQRYKSWPKVGTKVDVETDENDYWKITP
jgi:hypothetical protein